jgi:transposase-like protein
MNVDQLRQRFPNEDSCREFFESVIWPEGPVCPHCQGRRAWRLSGAKTRAGLLECADCSRQFTVTVGTPFHGTKLSLWVWLQVMYSLIFSSKGASSVFIARWVGVSQKTAWKMLHALRLLMAAHQGSLPKLQGIVELDEKYLGGKPRYQHGVKHKRGHGTAKSCVATAVQRQGPVQAKPIISNGVAHLKPFVLDSVCSQAHLMSDELSAYGAIAPQFAAHETVSHGQKEYARGEVHSNTAESFHATLERAIQGVYHWMSKPHLPLYTAESAFRWNQRRAVEHTVKSGKYRGQQRMVMERLPLVDQFHNLLSQAIGCQLRRTPNNGIRILPGSVPLFGL